MAPRAYYNEIDAYAAQWLRNLIEADLIAPGDVDTRSIVDVRPDDLRGYTQCHFFAGIGGWSYAARLAGWPDERLLWTGSCPCQPYSIAGKGLGQKDERDLWPVWFGLVGAVRPTVIMGEQVKDAIGKHWLDRMRADLEGAGYSLGASVLPACSVDAPHRRDRLWFVADSNCGQSGQIRSDLGEVCGLSEAEREPELSASVFGGGGTVRHDDVGDTIVSGLEGQPRHGDDRDQSGRLDAEPIGPIAETGSTLPDTDRLVGGQGRSIDDRGHSGGGPEPWAGPSRDLRNATAWSGAEFAIGADGKARRVEPGIRLLAHGVPARVGKLRAYGNAIVPQLAAEVIGAYLDLDHARAA